MTAPTERDTNAVPYLGAARPRVFWLGVSLWVLYVALAVIWTFANLSDVPHYGDTKEYLRFAREGKVNRVRGPIYPWILRAAAQACVESEIPQRIRWKEEEEAKGALTCAIPAGFMWVQVLQILICGLCLAYFIRQILPAKTGTFPRDGPLLFGGLLCLVLSDPLVNHFNLALMTDGLCFSASLAFCAALAHLMRRQVRPFWPSLILICSFLLAAGLRVEKKWVLLATLVLSAVTWWFLAWRRQLSWSPQATGRSLCALLLVSVGFVAVGVLQDRSSYDDSWWTPAQNAIHFRLVYPHLASVYDQLPDRAQARISRADAELYSGDINRVRQVINHAAGGDEAVRAELTQDLVRTVVAEEWPALIVDTGSDILANGFSTASFYPQVLGWKWLRWQGGANGWAYSRLVYHHPDLSLAYVLWSGFVLLIALTIALFRGVHQICRGWRPVPDRIWMWVPAVLFWWLNAAAFGVTVNITNIRYMIASHAMFLFLIYLPTLRWLLSQRSA